MRAIDLPKGVRKRRHVNEVAEDARSCREPNTKKWWARYHESVMGKDFAFSFSILVGLFFCFVTFDYFIFFLFFPTISTCSSRRSKNCSDSMVCSPVDSLIITYFVCFVTFSTRARQPQVEIVV